jgi:hypothetical protein
MKSEFGIREIRGRVMNASETGPPPSDFDGSVPKKPTSQRKIEANRRNARRSTGPRTSTGKKTVSQNAVKHGLLAREVVILDGDGKEDGDEFQELLERLRADYQPVGVVEEMLVEKIATSWWRLGRVLRAENGEIRGKLDSTFFDYVDRMYRNYSFTLLSLDLSQPQILSNFFNRADPKILLEEPLLKMQTFANELRKHEIGVSYLRRVLTNVKRDISERGKISKPVWELFFMTFGPCEYELVNACIGMLDNLEAVTSEVAQDARPTAIQLIDKRLQGLEFDGHRAERRSYFEWTAERRTFSLPSEEAAEKLLRYETHLERQYYRAMDQLERVQRRRIGDSVPPPLNVNLARPT